MLKYRLYQEKPFLKMQSDLFFMNEALKLAGLGRRATPPNPWVGCVIVKEGKIVGQGYHQGYGMAHAEVNALEEAKEEARGATAYITLEPCNHFGKTPPCTQALVNAGVKKVVIPFLDPDPRVSGLGVEFLKREGIEVICGICEKEATDSLLPYLHQRKTGLPFCVLKAAISLDGKIAAENFSSKWIIGEQAREDVHHLRADSQAILIGVGTAIQDDPKLNVRLKNISHKLLRVILDSKGKLTSPSYLFDPSLGPTLIFTTSLCPKDQIKQWQAKGVEVQVVEQDENKQVSLPVILKILGEKKIIQLLVEGGQKIHGAFLKQNGWDRLCLYIGNCVLGPCGHSFIDSLAPQDIQEAPRWKVHDVKQFANDIKIIYHRQ